MNRSDLPRVARRRIVVLALSIAALILPAAAARAGQYTFINYVDQSGDLGGFFPPTVNSSLAVAFVANRDVGGMAVYRLTPGGRITIADLDGPFSGFNEFPGINGAGSVAFLGFPDSPGGGGIYVGSGGPLTTIADAAGAVFSGFTGTPSINSAGTVAFRALLDDARFGVFKGNGGGSTTTAYDSSSPVFSDFGKPAINDAGTLAFRAALDAGGTGIFTGTGGPTTPIGLSSGPLFSSFSDVVSINASGTVAFRANRDVSAGGGSGIFTGSGESTTTIADSSGPFNQFGDPSINTSGAIAFHATLDAAAGGGEGIFTGGDVVSDKVIGTGDALFGSTVTAVSFFRGLNDNGDIAFVYALANGSFGIAVAAVPEPGGLALAALGVKVLLRRRRRR